MIMTFYPTWIWACILSAAVGALVAFLLTRGKGSTKKIEDMKDCDKKFILLGLRDDPTYFADLYEPVYVLSQGNVSRKDAIIDAWNARVASSNGSLEFKNAFTNQFGHVEKWKGKDKNYVKAAKKLCKYMKTVSIKRDESTAVSANETTMERYEIVGGVAFEAGATYDVLAPFWYNDDEILCKGVIR